MDFDGIVIEIAESSAHVVGLLIMLVDVEAKIRCEQCEALANIFGVGVYEGI